uniref:Predicted transcriptional regulator of N-Acetylglucosamine utilization, GntR family n=1 Tax=uncultured Thiotrichaceae bacterium TaxID=298394 RepID=A0A6S6U9D5_9GAMM|nr:MAG: Predicted transcriptional regulator of N-Acetylglucosamine utilization, GntR family [uncultured Thiotrichaceae bacterium]
MSLNTQSPLPLYQQLANRIRREVSDGVYQVNEKIPSENELSRHYDIGRPTVRQATDLLVREGVLLRKRGSGTFVQAPTQQIDLFSLAGTSAAFDQSQQPVDMTLLKPVVLLNGESCPAASGHRAAYHLQRLSSVDGDPVLLEAIYLDADIFHGIDQHISDGRSLSGIVREAYFLEASAAEQSFNIIYPDKTIAASLKSTVRLPLLHVSRILHFGEQKAAIYCDIYCRTDRFHFSQTLIARI